MSNRMRLFMQKISLLLILFVPLFLTAPTFALDQPVLTEVKPSTVPVLQTTDAAEPGTSVYDQAGPQENYAEKNYKRLEKALAFFDAAAAHPEMYPWPTVPDTERLLHRGSKNQAVFALRQLLKTTHDLSADAEDSNVYNKELERAVKLFQWRNNLNADGVVGPKTRADLNISPMDRAKQIRADLERWKALIGHVGDRFVLVNIPEYKLYLYDHDLEVLNMKVIVGKPSWPTPELQSNITRIVFNPRWNVPHRIARNDIIPKIIADPSYLNDNHIRVFNNGEENAYEINPQDVNWERAREQGFNYFFRQDAGEVNALGQVKFEFQNTHDVYLHDTPAKTLFDSDLRSLSHGCIRLEKPFDLVNYLTQDDPRIDQLKIQDKLDSLQTSYFRVQHSIPIIITYLTSWVDDNGIVHFVDDVYHRDDPNYVAPSQTVTDDAQPMERAHHSHENREEDYDRYDPYYSDHEDPGEGNADGL